MRIPFRCTAPVFQEFSALISRLDGLDMFEDAAMEIKEQIRSLTGFPNEYDEERDLIVPSVSETHYSSR